MTNGLEVPYHSAVKAISQLGAVGALIAITMWLVYTSTVERAAVFRELAVLDGRLETHVVNTNRRQRESLAMLRLICQNTAKTQAERASCVRDP